MIRNVVFVGAGDAIGRRIADDIEAMGCNVARILLPGQTEEGIALDSLDIESIRQAASEVAKIMPAPDMLVINIDRSDPSECSTILEKQDWSELIQEYNVNAIGPVAVLYGFRPLLDQGDGKRICVVTTAEGSNYACVDQGGFGRHMSRAALNMAMNLEFNGLRPKGYTMRMYCKDQQAPEADIGAYAAEYFLRNRSNEPESYKHSDENRLVLRDAYARELPW